VEISIVILVIVGCCCLIEAQEVKRRSPLRELKDDESEIHRSQSRDECMKPLARECCANDGHFLVQLELMKRRAGEKDDKK